MPVRSGVNANFGNFSSDVQRMSDNFVQEVKELVEVTLGDIEMDAIRKAPGPGDKIMTDYGPESQEDIRRGNSWTPISQAIGYKVNSGGLSGEVFVEKSAGEIAIFTEVGTGHSAREYLSDKPASWKAMAMLYYVNGEGTIIDQPYMLPAVLRAEIQFKKEMRQLLQRQRP